VEQEGFYHALHPMSVCDNPESVVGKVFQDKIRSRYRYFFLRQKQVLFHNHGICF
jgi:hypothetical protein